ncbi:guanine nucleotide binding protein, alpha subunit [Irpex rosettiformis]|uniref:Guanine nucleotide binding protein, alpha subunit n=1 Tax=Irpex rosettiformis TaxID=378272 RepID=A0ACB8ULG1_9APHY|nr:guanine nucleotide binding protein, alpha subunit [Irpex rosettiformis]
MSRTAYSSSYRFRSGSDPLAAILQPPPNETPAEREERHKQEQEAKKRSDNIDRMIRETDRRNRKRKTVKVLLLGQSESGKSTTLKQFQLLHAPAEFRAERLAWRFVIYLNLLRSVRRILEAIAPDADSVWSTFDDTDDIDNVEPAAIVIRAPRGSKPRHAQPNASPDYERYMKNFRPLFELEQQLISQLSDRDENTDDEATHLPPQTQAWANAMTPVSNGLSRVASEGSSPPVFAVKSISQSLPPPPVSPTADGELSVPTTSNWKKVFAFGRAQNPKYAHSGELQGWWEDPHDPVHIMNRFAPLITELWRDPKVRRLLTERRVLLEESSGFYLDEIDRITATRYFPTDEDVLKARLRTTGVTEHVFKLNDPGTREIPLDWIIYDVGGARHQRHAWAPYFDNVDAIIFLAPISAFDQVLVEDMKYNRLQDSFELWKLVVSNSLLGNVNLILFLNKCDLLKKKLQNGVKLKNHLHTYRGPNDFESVTKYFKNKFGAIHQSYTPNRTRELFVHFTSVTNTRTTRTIIMSVRDAILHTNLKNTALM